MRKESSAKVPMYAKLDITASALLGRKEHPSDYFKLENLGGHFRIHTVYDLRHVHMLTVAGFRFDWPILLKYDMERESFRFFQYEPDLRRGRY